MAQGLVANKETDEERREREAREAAARAAAAANAREDGIIRVGGVQSADTPLPTGTSGISSGNTVRIPEGGNTDPGSINNPSTSTTTIINNDNGSNALLDFLQNFEFPEIAFPDFGEILEGQQRNSSLSLLDSMWSQRFEAVNASITEVDRRIEDEQSRALLLGVDYEVDPAERERRIGELFGTVWTETNESRLNSLASKYGNPEQDDATRAQIEAGTLAYEFEFDVNRLTRADRETPRREREEQVGDDLLDKNNFHTPSDLPASVLGRNPSVPPGGLSFPTRTPPAGNLIPSVSPLNTIPSIPSGGLVDLPRTGNPLNPAALVI